MEPESDKKIRGLESCSSFPIRDAKDLSVFGATGVSWSSLDDCNTSTAANLSEAFVLKKIETQRERQRERENEDGNKEKNVSRHVQ